jgi:hypothetical protein
MKAATITQPGGPEVLQWADVPDPVPGDGEVLIEHAQLFQQEGDTRHKCTIHLYRWVIPHLSWTDRAVGGVPPKTEGESRKPGP